MRLTTFIAAATALWLTTPVACAQDELAAAIDPIFAEYDSTHSPGCSVGVIQNGAFVFKRGYGMADLEHGIALTPSSVFRIGSTSKQFTAAVIALLEQEGRLSLDDDIRRHLPEIPGYGQTITIRHLLHHTSGLRDYLTLFSLAGYRNDDWYDERQVLAMLARQQELNFPPGAEHLYSNSGYFLLSEIAGRAAGRSMREFAAEKVFKPLGMSHTHFHNDHTEIVADRAMGYAPRRAAAGFRHSMTTLNMIGDGGVFTTVEDLAKWDANFYDPQVGGPALLETLLERGRLNDGEAIDYALGLSHGSYRGLETVSHGGAFVGFRAQMIRFPEQKTTIVCLCNLATTNPTALSRRVADVVLADQLGPAAAPASRSAPGRDAGEGRAPTAEERRLYAGAYYSEELDQTYRLVEDDDVLMLEVGSRRAPVTFRGDDHLEARRMQLRFTRRGDDVTGFRLDAGRVKNLRFRPAGR